MTQSTPAVANILRRVPPGFKPRGSTDFMAPAIRMIPQNLMQQFSQSFSVYEVVRMLRETRGDYVDSDFLYIKDPIVRQAVYDSMDMTPPANLEELRMLPDVMNLREKMLKQLASDVMAAIHATTTPKLDVHQSSAAVAASGTTTIVRRQLPDAAASSHLITDEQLESAVKQAIEVRPTVAATKAAAADATDGYQALKNIDRSQMQRWRVMDPKYALIDLAVYGSAEADNVRRAAEELAICEHVPTIAVALTFGRGEREQSMVQQQQLQNQQPPAQSRENRSQPMCRLQPQQQQPQHQLQHQPQHQQQLHRQLRSPSQPSIGDYNRYNQHNNRCYVPPSQSMLQPQQPQQPQQVITTNVIQVVNNVLPTVWLMSNSPTASASDWNGNYNPGFPPLHNSMSLGLRQQQQQQHQQQQQQQQTIQLDYYQSTVTTAAYSMLMNSENTADDGADVDANASDLTQRHWMESKD